MSPPLSAEFRRRAASRAGDCASSRRRPSWRSRRAVPHRNRRPARRTPAAGTSSAARGARPASATRSPSALTATRRCSISPDRCCSRVPHVPASGSARRRSCSPTARRASSAARVWTDQNGDRVYSEIRGDGTKPGDRITGTIVGGTGRYAGATGAYEFTWQFVLEAEDGTVAGRTQGLAGRVRIERPQPAPGAQGAKP